MTTKPAELGSAYGDISNAPGRRCQAQTIETIAAKTSAGITGATTVAEAHEAIAAIAIADRVVGTRNIGRARSVPSDGGVKTGTITAAGSGYNGGAAGTITSVALTGGLGVGAVATIVVSASGAVTGVTITTAGSGYIVGNVLSAAAIGAAGGSAFAYTVASVL
jgi:hypothetical protein